MPPKKKKTPEEIRAEAQEKREAKEAGASFPETKGEIRSGVDLTTQKGQERERELAAFTGVSTREFRGEKATKERELGVTEEELQKRAEPIVAEGQELIGRLSEDITGESPIVTTGEAFKDKREAELERGREERKFITDLFTGKASKGKILEEAKKLGGGILIAGALAIPLVAVQASLVSSAAFISSGIAKFGTLPTFAKGAIATVGTAGAGVGVIAAGGSIKDWERGEIAIAQEIMQGFIEEGERLEADTRNGLQPTDTIERLTQMADQVDDAVSTIQQKSILNFEYQSSKEYKKDIQRAIAAREAIRRRVRAVVNIANTGTAALNPEALRLNVIARE